MPGRPSRCARRASTGPRGAAVALAVLLVAAGGVQPQRAPEPVPADRLPTASPSAAGTATTARARVWGARGQLLVPVFVELTDTGVAARVRALLALAEPGQRPPTALRSGTRLLRLDQSGDVVELTLSDELHQVPMGELPLALGQLVLTVTEQPGVLRVHVRAGDAPVRYVDATGRTISRPLLRNDFAGLAQSEADE